jgi:hypothetical protein
MDALEVTLSTPNHSRFAEFHGIIKCTFFYPHIVSRDDPLARRSWEPRHAATNQACVLVTGEWRLIFWYLSHVTGNDGMSEIFSRLCYVIHKKKKKGHRVDHIASMKLSVTVNQACCHDTLQVVVNLWELLKSCNFW